MAESKPYKHSFLPVVKQSDYNDLVQDYNELVAQGAIDRRDFARAKATIEANDAAIASLRLKVKDLDNKPTFQADVQKLNGMVDEAKKTLKEVMRAWNWRKENAKAGPKALWANREDIERHLNILTTHLVK